MKLRRYIILLRVVCPFIIGAHLLLLLSIFFFLTNLLCLKWWEFSRQQFFFFEIFSTKVLVFNFTIFSDTSIKNPSYSQMDHLTLSFWLPAIVSSLLGRYLKCLTKSLISHVRWHSDWEYTLKISYQIENSNKSSSCQIHKEQNLNKDGKFRCKKQKLLLVWKSSFLSQSCSFVFKKLHEATSKTVSIHCTNLILI